MKLRPITGVAPSVEKNSGDTRATGSRSVAPASPTMAVPNVIDGQTGERGNAAAAFVIVGDGGTVAIDARLGVRIENGDETAGIGKRQRAEKDGIHHSKNGEIRADADGEGQQGGGRESGRFSQHPDSVAKLPGQFIEGVKPARLAALFLNCVQAAELDAGAPFRLPAGKRRSAPDRRCIVRYETGVLRTSPVRNRAGISAHGGASEGV